MFGHLRCITGAPRCANLLWTDLGVEPTRIDWLYTPIVDEKPPPEGFLTIGSLDGAIKLFAQLMNRWFAFDTCPPVQRLAFGVVVLQPVENLLIAYRQLIPYLRSVHLHDLDNTSDFLYQINRRRNSTVISGLRINRLSKWSAASKQRQTISLPTVTVPIQQELGSLYFASRLELDINTVSEFQGEFERRQLASIFEELIGFAVEIANHGDIP